MATTVYKHGDRIVKFQNKICIAPITLAGFTINTTDSPQDFTFYLNTPSNLVVEWGDGTANDTFTTTGNKTHSYATAGDHTLKIISGTCTRLGFGTWLTTPALVKEVVTVISAALGLTSAEGMFFNCTNITSWATGFFDAASANITNMDYMFAYVSGFNKSLSGWNTAKVTSMVEAFRECASLNQDISGWNVTALRNATGMLYGSGFTQTNYDLLLNINTGWPSQNVQNSVAFHAGTAKYDNENADVANGRAHLATDHSWTITDGGPD